MQDVRARVVIGQNTRSAHGDAEPARNNDVRGFVDRQRPRRTRSSSGQCQFGHGGTFRVKWIDRTRINEPGENRDAALPHLPLGSQFGQVRGSIR